MIASFASPVNNHSIYVSRIFKFSTDFQFSGKCANSCLIKTGLNVVQANMYAPCEVGITTYYIVLTRSVPIVQVWKKDSSYFVHKFNVRFYNIYLHLTIMRMYHFVSQLAAIS